MTWKEKKNKKTCISLTHLGGLLYTAGQLLEQLEQREEALENDAVRNVQSTQLQQEDRLKKKKKAAEHTSIQINAIYLHQNIFFWYGMEYQK